MNFPRTILSFAAALMGLSTIALGASITGTVTNKTTGKPAGGDTVTLIKLAQGMQEAGSTKTDARGKYTLDVPDDGIHLVRVTHDKANYFQPVQPGAKTADVDVFTGAAKVEGVTGEAEVLRVQTDASGNSLDVVANFFVKNVSTPPKTQFSDRAFEFYLPPGAVVEGSVALGPGKMSMPVKSPPVPIGDIPDHYAFLFPLRPCASPAEAEQDEHCGETRFQVSYHIPYKGSLVFAPKVSMPTDTVAIMLPKGIAFKAAPGATYAAATDETNAQAWVARNVVPDQPLGFTISGSGQLPRDSTAGAPQGSASAADSGTAQGTAATDTRPGGGLGVPLDPEGNNDPWAKYKWWILGGLALTLAAGAGLMLRVNPASATTATVGQAAAAPADAMLQVLKDELFALETERLEGRLDDAQYATQKSALEVVLRRALARSGVEGTASASNL